MMWIFKILVILLAIYIGIAALLFFFQRKMIYHAYDSPDKTIDNVVVKGFQEIETTTKDGRKVISWYKPVADPKQSTIIWFHGNAINSKDSVPLISRYAKAGLGILFAEYPGYAGNEGKPTEKGLYQNSRALISWLIEQGVPEDQIVLYGQSIGSGAAIQMATEFTNIRALILEAPFSSIESIAKQMFFFLPVKLLLLDRFDNVNKIKNIQTPTVFIHGEADNMIPIWHTKLLIEASSAEKKAKIFIPEAGHNDLYLFEVEPQVLNIIKQ